METQLRHVTKEEAHRLIDSIQGDSVYVLTYDQSIGISDNGRLIKKKKSKKFVDKAKGLVLSQSRITTLNLHENFLKDYSKEGIVRTIMLPKLE